MANKKRITLLMMFCAASFVANGVAGEQPDSNATLTIGPGLVITGKPYSGMDTSVYPIPLMLFTWGRFYVSGATAGYRLLADEHWTFDAVGKWRFDGYEEDDSDDLDGMHDRRMTVDLGGELSIFDAWGSALKVGFLTDSLGRHDGQEIRISYSKAFDVEKLRVAPSVGFIWQSSNLVDYYYGVRTDEARPGRPAYNVDDAVNWFAGIHMNYALDDKWTLLAGVTYHWLDSDIHDSPIVDDTYMISVTAGAIYKF